MTVRGGDAFRPRENNKTKELLYQMILQKDTAKYRATQVNTNKAVHILPDFLRYESRFESRACSPLGGCIINQGCLCVVC